MNSSNNDSSLEEDCDFDVVDAKAEEPIFSSPQLQRTRAGSSSRERVDSSSGSPDFSFNSDDYDHDSKYDNIDFELWENGGGSYSLPSWVFDIEDDEDIDIVSNRMSLLEELEINIAQVRLGGSCADFTEFFFCQILLLIHLHPIFYLYY